MYSVKSSAMRLAQRGDQGAQAAGGDFLDLAQQVVDLGFHRTHDAQRVDQSRRAHHLFGEHAAGALQLPRPRRRGYKDGVRAHGLPFLEFQRPVIDTAWQAEAEFGQRRFSVEVAPIHTAQLRHGDVAFIDYQQRVFRKILKKCRRRLTRVAPGEIARIVLDAGTEPGGIEHFQIESGAFLQTLGLQQLALGGQFAQRVASIPP